MVWTQTSTFGIRGGVGTEGERKGKDSQRAEPRTAVQSTFISQEQQLVQQGIKEANNIKWPPAAAFYHVATA